MNNDTQWTPSEEDSLLNLADKAAINEEETRGFSRAEIYVYKLDTETPITTSLILEIHRVAFRHLYDWAGKWRTTNVVVGILQPPERHQVVQLMYQFLDNLNFKLSVATNRDEHLNCLLYAHHEFIRIHPFNNGNGRTGRLLMNLVAMKLGYRPLVFYHREGESRRIYIEALRAADKGDAELLLRLIDNELTVQ